MIIMKKPSIAIVYTDQGPGGPCGQDCITTSCWTKVYLFNSESEARVWLDEFVIPKRKKSRITMCYLDPQMSGGTQTLEYL